MIQSIGGVQFPPRKKLDAKKWLHFRFAITGTIPSKKNRQIASINWNKINGILNKHKLITHGVIKKVNAVKPYIRRSGAYEKWEIEFRENIVKQAAEWSKAYEKHGVVFPLKKATISIYHYWADNKIRDNSNKMESINDALVACGIITSDAARNLPRITAEAGVYSGEILDHITLITISAFDW